PRLQEIVRQDSVPRRLRRRRRPLPALRQQERRAALVSLLRHYLKEERLRTAPAAAPNCVSVKKSANVPYASEFLCAILRRRREGRINSTTRTARGGAPRSIGLLTNQTGVDSEGKRYAWFDDSGVAL